LGLWRAGRDGSGAEQLRAGVEAGDSSSPGVSVDRDVTRVVFSFNGTVYLADAQRNTEPRQIGQGTSPVWSPSGDRLAYVGLGDVLTVASRDGGDAPVRSFAEFEPGVTWSPDGAWLLGRTLGQRGQLLLVRVADGLAIPLPLPIDLRQPSWR
jgi:Tol biopolymer transport system component